MPIQFYHSSLCYNDFYTRKAHTLSITHPPNQQLFMEGSCKGCRMDAVQQSYAIIEGFLDTTFNLVLTLSIALPTECPFDSPEFHPPWLSWGKNTHYTHC